MTLRLPNNFINAYNNVNNEKSRTFIIYTTSRLEALINIKFSDWSISSFLDMDNILNKIDQEIPSAQIHLLSTIKRFLSFKNKRNTLIYNQYSKKINAMYKVHNSNRNNKIKEKYNSSSLLDYNNLKNIYISKISDIKKERYIQFRNYLILGFYILETPTQLCHLTHMKYIKEPTTLLKNIEDKTNNYISKINGVYNITYNNFKNNKYIGQVNTTITNLHLSDLLDYYFSNFVIESGSMLYNGIEFTTQTGNTSIGEAIRKITFILTGTRYCVNDIRQGFLKQYYRHPDLTYEDKVNTCRDMGVVYNPLSDALICN